MQDFRFRAVAAQFLFNRVALPERIHDRDGRSIPLAYLVLEPPRKLVAG
jgi:hypothetical protein